MNQLKAATEQDTDTFYRRIAARDCAEKGSFTIEAAIALVGGYAGLAIVGSPIGVLFGAALPVSWIAYKLWDGYEGLKEVESGDWVNRLPEREKQRYLKDKAAETRALPAGQDTTAPGAPMRGVLEGGIVAPPMSKDWKAQQWELWNRITKDCPTIRYLIFANLIVISGPQQTGKSSLASAIAYTRSILTGKPTQAITPHIDGATVFKGAEVIGHGGNFEAIDAWYKDLKEGLTMGGDRTTLVIDELTQYQDDYEKLGQAIVKTAISESTKHGLDPILINHATTVSAGFANIKGVRGLIDTSAVQVTRQYQEAEWGETQRSPIVAIVRPGKDSIEVTIPAWFHLPTLEQSYGAVPWATVTHQQDEAPQWLEDELVQSDSVDTVGQLNRLYGMDAEPTPFDAADLAGGSDEGDRLPSPKLTKDQAALVEFAQKRKTWLTAREVKNCCSHFKMKDCSTGDIREVFIELASLGVGDVEGEGDRLKYRILAP
ncbi:MAG: hypothetical protein IGR90_06220 [Synechococcales cyanobacterium K32_A2020_035]|nr:hypothetical protein [Synechococcales cyanobacterium K32_A2020_035]